MAAEEHAGRFAGLAVSLGIGIAVAVGGIGDATAEPGDAASSSDSADSGSKPASRTSNDATTDARSADRADADDDTGGPSARQNGSRSLRESISSAESESATESDTDPRESPTADAAPRRGPLRSSHRETTDTQEFSTARLTEDAEPSEVASPPTNNAPPPGRQSPPVETQALSAVLGAARRPADLPPTDPETPTERPSVNSNVLAGEPDSESDAAIDPTGSEFGPAAAASTSPANTAPTATATIAAPDGITGVTKVAVTASDIDGDALTYTASRPIWGWVSNLGDGNFTYSTNEFVRLLARFLPFINSDRFSVTVNDGQGGTASVNVNTTVIPLNSAPVLRSRSVGTPNATTGVVVGGVTARDPNFDSLSYIPSTATTDKGTVSVNGGGGFTYTPTATARHAAAAESATTADKTDTFKVQVVDKFGAVAEIPVTVNISPINSAPTGTSTVGSPDAVSGLATGTVLGEDTDGDTLSYSGSTTTLKGTFVVDADGSFTYVPTPSARYNAWHPYATLSDGIDAVAVTIDDGHGGVTTVPVRVAISPSDQEPPDQGLSTFCGCTMMPEDTIFHADVRNLPVLPESDKFIELLGGSRGGTLKSGMGAKEWMGSTGGGLPVNIVEASHPKETVIFNRGYSTTGPGIDDRPYPIPSYPIVEGMPSAPAWDRHLLVFQKETCISYELINVAHGYELPAAGVLDGLGSVLHRALWGDAWTAQGGAQYDMSSGLYPEIGFANASQIPFLPMLLRPDDLERGEIDHMLGFVIAAGHGAGFTWPARNGDGTSPDGVPMGTVFRLNSDFDITGYSRATQVILRGLQVHGGVIYDSGPEGDYLALGNIRTEWTGTEHIEAARELNTIPLEFFEAVDVSALAVDPAVGWYTR